MPSENLVVLGQSVLPPALAAVVMLVTCIAWQYSWERRKRRGFRESLERNRPQLSASALASACSAGSSRTHAPSPAGVAAAKPEPEAFPTLGSYFLDHVGHYVLSILFVGLTLGIRLLLEPQLHGRLAFGFFLLAVIATALVAHIWETVLALVLGYVAAAWFFVKPVGFGISGADGWLGAALYFATGMGIIWFMKSEHRAWLRTLDRDIAYVDRLKDLDRERAARTLPEDRERLARIVESAQDAILSVTPAGRIATWNPAAERMFGFSASEAIGQPPTLIVPPQLRAEQQRLFAQVHGGERTGEWQTVLSCKDGSTIPVTLSLSAMTDRPGKLIGASVIARPRSSDP